MSNKRDLKRNVNYVCSELFSEVVAASMYSDKVSDYVRRVSHVEPGMKPKVFFKNLTTSFNKQVSEIVDQVVSLG